MVYSQKTGYSKDTSVVATRQKFISHSPSSLSPSCLVGHSSPRGTRSPVLSAWCSAAFSPQLPAHARSKTLSWPSSMWPHPKQRKEREAGGAGPVPFQTRPGICMYHSPTPPPQPYVKVRPALTSKDAGNVIFLWTITGPLSLWKKERWISGQPLTSAQRVICLKLFKSTKGK